MHIRKAIPSDYESIWSIWMQDHIIQWMSFPKQSKEDFAAHYARMEKASDIYVLVDNIDGHDKVVAVRRIKFGKGQSQHIAEYCSMGVDKQFLGKGYAKFFYEEFEKIARKVNIKRIQLTQSGGNETAFHIADNKNFLEEAVFPDWLERTNNEGHYYLIERYIYRFIDNDLAELASKLPSLKYKETFPLMKSVTENNGVAVVRNNNQFICNFQGNSIFTLDFEPDDSVIQHIGFLTVTLHSISNQAEMEIGLRNILIQLLEENRVKKLELFTSDPIVINICRNLGFFVRGEKIASCCDGGVYKNELGIEYSFFDVSDAKKLLLAKVSDVEKSKTLDEALSNCTITINKLVGDKSCDVLGARYLENLIYQMVRDELGPNKVYSLSDKRWKNLLSQTPIALHNDLLRLFNRLQSSSSVFYSPNTSISSLSDLSDVPATSQTQNKIF